MPDKKNNENSDKMRIPKGKKRGAILPLATIYANMERKKTRVTNPKYNL